MNHAKTIHTAKSNPISARFHICADGGANRLYQVSSTQGPLIPEYVAGDLDSVYKDVLLFYEKQVPILHNPFPWALLL